MLMISLVIVLTLASCSTNESVKSTKKVRVIGTAIERSTRSLSGDIAISSIEKYTVDGKDITSELKPINTTVKNGDNNVEFQAEVEVLDRVTLSASAKEGYIFDKWDVLDLDDDNSSLRVSEEFLEKIERWLESNNLKYNEKLDNVPSEYISYLVAEYDNGFYLDLEKEDNGKGIKDDPYSVNGFIQMMENSSNIYDEDELSLVISGSNPSDFEKLVRKINELDDIDELKIKANNEKLSLSSIPSLQLEEITLFGFKFNDLTLSNSSSEFKFENCTFTNLIIDDVEEIEINGGSAETITIIKGEEIELKNMNKISLLDLSRMIEGDVEIENCKYDNYKAPSSNSDCEVEIE